MHISSVFSCFLFSLSSISIDCLSSMICVAASFRLVSLFCNFWTRSCGKTISSYGIFYEEGVIYVLTIFPIMELLNTIINSDCEFYDYNTNMSLQLVGPSIKWPSRIYLLSN